ncbi:MAG: hypothetical protein MPW15_19275 [Candidatus Manganitrophus sp.]|nr:hypothetical protein [Candidatus Manganitrophus sp.]
MVGFCAGGAAGFILHEGAHALVAESLGFDARLESRGKPIPFIVVRYDLVSTKDENGQIRYTDEAGRPVSDGAQKQYAIASAGINSQNITSEIILTLHPNLREERRPFLKGVLAFDIVVSAGYALIGRKDPDGDLRGMSEALGVNDKWMATLVFCRRRSTPIVTFIRSPAGPPGSVGYRKHISWDWRFAGNDLLLP